MMSQKHERAAKRGNRLRSEMDMNLLDNISASYRGAFVGFRSTP